MLTTGHQRDVEKERKASMREKATAHARRGEVWPYRIEETTLVWAFEGLEQELEALAELSADARAQKDQAAARSAERRDLKAMTAQVLSEWEADRQCAAQAEARRRLELEAS